MFVVNSKSLNSVYTILRFHNFAENIIGSSYKCVLLFTWISENWKTKLVAVYLRGFELIVNYHEKNLAHCTLHSIVYRIILKIIFVQRSPVRYLLTSCSEPIGSLCLDNYGMHLNAWYCLFQTVCILVCWCYVCSFYL